MQFLLCWKTDPKIVRDVRCMKGNMTIKWNRLFIQFGIEY